MLRNTNGLSAASSFPPEQQFEMASYNEPEYFAQAEKTGHIIVRDPPKFDLEAYIANYRGRTRFERLLLIGTSSTHLYFEALKAAVAEAKQGVDVQRYEAAVTALQEVVPSDPDARPDATWIEKTTRQLKAQTDHLELELKGYKNNLIKESTRMGYEDLGRHYHAVGELTLASKAFGKMREHCITHHNIFVMSLHVINVSIEQQNWHSVQSNVSKLRIQAAKYPETEFVSGKFSAAMGISCLALGSFKEAASHFLDTNPRMIHAKVDDLTDKDSYNEVITPNDVAVYGGLCALASMNREELQRRVLENSSFRNYLGLEPHIRRAISAFVSSKYSTCLSILNSYKGDYLLDIYLRPHIHELYARVRSKAIQQYFIPFSCVTLSALAKAFDTDVPSIEVELTTMIKHGSLDARIDLVDSLLLANTVDGRKKVHEDALKMAKEYERTAYLRILRMETLNAGLEVKSLKGQGYMSMSLLGAGDGSTNVGPEVFGSSGQGRFGLRNGGKFG